MQKFMVPIKYEDNQPWVELISIITATVSRNICWHYSKN
jgi:hypothetical protein